jgi:hypothetical protein
MIGVLLAEGKESRRGHHRFAVLLGVLVVGLVIALALR